MLRKAILGFCLLTSAVLNNFAFADNAPTLHEVYQATRAGRLDEAQNMMSKVLQAHPNSAKAHYVEAEILAKQGDLSKAGGELNNAERLEPGLPFAKPQAVRELKSIIASAQHAGQPVLSGIQPATGTNFPWGILLLGVGAIVAIVFFVRAMNARNPNNFPNGYQPNGPTTFGTPMQPYGSSGIGPMSPAGGGMGSGIMGGLATGAAVGVGMVAGEALAHHFMDGNNANTASAATDSWGNTPNDMGGTDFGIADNASWDDSSGIADVGGDDWNS
jgi:hypothetical protein